MNFKDINIGQIISIRFREENISIERVCRFLKCTEKDVEEMFLQGNISTDTLLKWSKLLNYDFFRIYSHHMVLYSPQKKIISKQEKISKQSVLPQFKKNLYTAEIISFILELISSGKKTKQQIIEEYRIPKTTLYKWEIKYKT